MSIEEVMRLERLQRTGGSGAAGGEVPRQQAGLAERATLTRDAGLRAPVAGARGAWVGGRGEAKILERLEGMFREKDAALEREVPLSHSASHASTDFSSSWTCCFCGKNLSTLERLIGEPE